MGQCSDMDNQDNVLFGVVGVKLNFSVHKQAIEKLPDGLQGFHSSFSGDKVGAQVKGQLISCSEYTDYNCMRKSV